VEKKKDEIGQSRGREGGTGVPSCVLTGRKRRKKSGRTWGDIPLVEKSTDLSRSSKKITFSGK